MEEKRVSKTIQLIAQLSIDKASQMFSKLVGRDVCIQLEKSYTADISEVSSRMMEIPEPMIAALIQLEGDTPFGFLLYLNEKSAFQLTDLMLRKEPGTTQERTPHVTSAVQETANILASVISNVFASDFDVSLRPSPPTTIEEFMGTIFNEFCFDIIADRTDFLMIESELNIKDTDIVCNTVLSPKRDSEKILNYLANYTV